MLVLLAGLLLVLAAVTWAWWLALPAPLALPAAYAAWRGMSWGRFADAVDPDGSARWPV